MHNKELDRLLAVDRFLKLKLSKEQELNEIAQLAANICGTPIALITLLDEDTQYFKIAIGTKESKTTREDAFCNYVINQDKVIVVPDTAHDTRFANNPLRKSEINIQFYAGAPLITHDGLKLGSLCVIGHKPGNLSEQQIMMLATLSKQVIHILEFDYSLQIMKEQYLEAKKNEITLRSIFDSSNSCLALVDLDLKVLFYNKMLFDFMKVTYNKAIKAGIVITDIIRDDYIHEFIVNFNKARKGESVSKETLLTYPEKEIWWHYTYHPAYNSDGIVTGVSFTATDISELKKSQLKIIERDQSLHAIALIQSHEIRRPVASVLGLSELFRLNNYRAEKDELIMLERAVKELDSKIHHIIDLANDNNLPVNQ